MYNIRKNFRRCCRISKEFFESETDGSGNFQYYPRRPELSDVQIVALSCTMETLGIDSENLLWSKLWDRLCIAFSAPDLPHPF